ncbi:MULTISPECIES: hypothetical protein [unclassified Sphingomonas]|uniref:hypothetical protein n=1 Tax=unclassified Sphingomonas TaxID=196159 RepID=UPI00226AF73C|nr:MULTISPECIES: hypothetical protein [unclassified Sphingomonas]
MKTIESRVRALEEALPSSSPRLHCIRRYENETDEQAVSVYEGEHGPIGDGKVIMRVIINKPGSRPTHV